MRKLVVFLSIASVGLCSSLLFFITGKSQPTFDGKLLSTTNSGYLPRNYSLTNIKLRKFPYPYKAMLAISSDSDHETLRKFNLIHKFLNTREMTPMGQGLGLDISDSFFMYNGSDIKTDVDYNHTPLDKEFTYFNGISTQRYGGDIIDAYIHSGWLDSIHTYGDFSMTNELQTRFSRQLAVQSIEALQAAHDEVSVWIDHGNKSNVDNFGSREISHFYDYQEGDLPTSPYYHTDLLIPYGIKFVWADHSSDVFGRNSMIYPLKLTDGRKVWGFWRYTSSTVMQRNKTHWVWNIYFLDKQLDLKNLQSLELHHQYTILAQHFYADNKELPLPKTAIESFRLLASEYDAGNILVARTSRLLRYNVTEQYLDYKATQFNGKTIIHINSINDPVFGSFTPGIDDLRGVTFYTNDPQNTVIEIGDQPIDKNLIQENPTDGVGTSIGIKWYPEDIQNYERSDSNVW